MLNGMKHVVMVVPVNTDINKTEQVTNENRKQRMQRIKFSGVRYFKLQHHNSDDDGQYAITKCFQPSFSHSNFLSGLFNMLKVKRKIQKLIKFDEAIA